jgi:hypothetical protein
MVLYRLWLGKHLRSVKRVVDIDNIDKENSAKSRGLGILTYLRND